MMGTQDKGLKDLFQIIGPLLLWTAAGWFLYPYIVSTVEIPDASGANPMLSYLVGFICLIFGLIFLVYSIVRKDQIR